MISREAIRERAIEWQLRVDVVEKDYVLGWLLAAMAEHPEASQQWVFKGGTCLKKCFFETYRFSKTSTSLSCRAPRTPPLSWKRSCEKSQSEPAS